MNILCACTLDARPCLPQALLTRTEASGMIFLSMFAYRLRWRKALRSQFSIASWYVFSMVVYSSCASSSDMKSLSSCSFAAARSASRVVTSRFLSASMACIFYRQGSTRTDRNSEEY
jgi:hypothetical protein